MNCSLCGRKIREDKPYISAAESIDISVHVSCFYTATPLQILRMLQLDIVFCYLSGQNAIALSDMNPEDR